MLANLTVLPHYKMILGRLLNSEPNKRYNNLFNLLSDFKQANKFRFDLNDFKQRSEDVKQALILVDFIFFRLRVISRNPNLKSDYYMTAIQQLSNLKYLDLSYNNLTKEQLMPFLNAMPNCKVINKNTRQAEKEKPNQGEFKFEKPAGK